MTLLKSAIIIPSLASGLWLVKTGPPVGAFTHAPVTGVSLSEYSDFQAAPYSAEAGEFSSDYRLDALEPEISQHIIDPNLILPGSDESEMEAKAEVSKKSRETAAQSAAQSKSFSQAELTEKAEHFIVERRLRIERVLMTLDFVAQATLQMSPENVDRIEPVLVDLTEQTLDLVTGEVTTMKQSDRDLGKIEDSVDGLVQAISRLVEPEMSI